ncbi:MAG: RagB/SusD family nutrient uptake outer membrane protein [Gemmatimonadales bacterium]
MRPASRLIRTATARAALVLAPVLAMAACNSLLEVQAPSRVLDENLSKPEAAKLLVDGARAALGCAFQAHITGNALLTDEMEDTQLAAAAWDWDRRGWTGALGQAYAQSPCTAFQIFGTYTPLQTARFGADDAVNRLNAFSDQEVPNRTALLAQGNLLAGYSRIFIGEGYCAAAIDLGPELAPKDFFTQAEQRFSEAITQAQTGGVSSTIGIAATLGRARARLNLARLPGQAVDLARYTAAKADANAVPAGFLYAMPYSTATTYAQNSIVQRNRLSLLYSVSANYRNLNDPRVSVTNSGLRGADAVNTVWFANKYTALNTPIPLAKYEEAQLILAEADLAAGSLQAAIDRLNTRRARTGVALPPYAGGLTPAEVQAFLLSERAKELFLEGHHFWDINRFNLPLDPAVGVPFPGKGGTYADLRCLPLPDIERLNNPNL